MKASELIRKSQELKSELESLEHKKYVKLYLELQEKRKVINDDLKDRVKSHGLDADNYKGLVSYTREGLKLSSLPKAIRAKLEKLELIYEYYVVYVK